MDQQRRKDEDRDLLWVLRNLPTLVPLLFLVAAFAVKISDPPFIRQLTSYTFDSLQRLQPRDYIVRARSPQQGEPNGAEIEKLLLAWCETEGTRQA